MASSSFTLLLSSSSSSKQYPFFPSTPSPKLPPTACPASPFSSPSSSSSFHLRVSSSSFPAATTPKSSLNKPPSEERIFFDGGAHYGDLVANLLLGFTLLWLPLTLAAVSRAFFLRYRFTNHRVTVISGLTGQDRSDFSYKSIKEVQVVPRFIGEWGDIIITLTDGTKLDLRSVPRFREIANYCLLMADKGTDTIAEDERPKGF